MSVCFVLVSFFFFFLNVDLTCVWSEDYKADTRDRNYLSNILGKTIICKTTVQLRESSVI